MSDLKVYRGSKRELYSQTRDSVAIAAILGELGASFEQHALNNAPDIYASQDEIIESQRELINALMQKHAFVSLDALSVTPDYPRLEKLLADFQSEHHHPEIEARLFLAGLGCFYLRVDDMVYALACEPGDFLSLPPQVSHWFKMDTSEPMCAVRLYSSAHGGQSIPVG